MDLVCDDVEGLVSELDALADVEGVEAAEVLGDPGDAEVGDLTRGEGEGGEGGEAGRDMRQGRVGHPITERNVKCCELGGWTTLRQEAHTDITDVVTRA